MSTYYVANAGSNSNNGTSSGTPFQTIAHARGVAIQDDVINLNGGDTFVEANAFTVGLTIQSYGTGQATIAPSAYSGSSTVGDALTFTNCGNITLSNFVVTGPGGTFSVGSRLIEILYSDGNLYQNVTLENLTLSNGINGFTIGNSDASAGVVCNNISWLNNTVHGFVQRGIDTGAGSSPAYSFSNVTVSGNVVYSMSGSSSFPGQGIYLEHVNGFTITGNLVHDIGASDTEAAGGAGIGFQSCENGTCGGSPVSANVVYNIFNYHTTPVDGTAYDLDAANLNCTISYNYAYNCDGPGVAMFSASGGNVIAYNVLENTGRNYIGGIALEAAGACDIYGNTVRQFTAFPAVGFQSLTCSTNKRLLNNAFFCPAGLPTVVLPASYTTTGFVMDGNYHQSGDSLFACKSNTTTDTTLANWHTLTGFETSGVAAGHCYLVAPEPPPALLPSTVNGISAFAPIAGSPLINAGANLLGTYSITPGVDFLGAAWTQNSIGAIYNAGTPTGYMQAVYADNPMAIFRMADASGTTSNDSVGTFETLVLSAVTLGSTAIVVGDGSPTSASFNGTSSTAIGVVTPHTYSLSAFTYEGWFELASGASALTNTLIESLSAGETDFIVWASGSPIELTAFVKDASTGNINGVATTTTLSTGTLYHFMVVWNGGTTLAVYINGISQTLSYSSQVALSALKIGKIQIGFDAAVPRRWTDGTFSDGALYATALSSTRAKVHYSAGTLVAGTATAGSVTSSSIAVSSTDATGGATPYAYQWQVSTDNVTWSSASGTAVTTKSATVTGLTASTLYYLRLQFTDANSVVVYGASVSATTSSSGGTGGGGIAGPTAEQLAAYFSHVRRRIKDGSTVPGWRARQRAK